jgi:LacI family transcriptional regulator
LRRSEELINQKLTIIDVAKQAGVSSGTVSNVINGSRQVSEGRRERVLRAIDELGYLPNSLAQGLRRRQSRVVGLCAPNSASSYFAALIDMFEEIAVEKGYEVMQVLSRHDSTIEHRRIRALLAQQVAGLIIIPSLDPMKTFDLVAKAGVPTVVVDRRWEDSRFDYVTVNNRTAMREAAQHLIGLGHVRLVYIVSYPSLVTTQHRIEAFYQAASDAHDQVSARVLERGQNETIFAQRLTEALRAPNPPTAIIASNSVVALWTMRTIKALGVRCPEHVSVLSFDEPDWADLIEPSLSIVRQPIQEVARTAWALLMGRMRDRTISTRHVELTAELQYRGSIRQITR